MVSFNKGSDWVAGNGYARSSAR